MRADDLLRPVGRRDAVGVDKGENLPLRLGDREVARVAGIFPLGEGEEPHARKPPRHHAGRPVRRAVDDDDLVASLVQPALDRAEAPLDRVAGVVDGDDDGEPGSAHDSSEPAEWDRRRLVLIAPIANAAPP